jgi:Rhodopirellula transposase DDE domain
MSNNQNLPTTSSSMLPYTSDIELQIQRLYKSLNETVVDQLLKKYNYRKRKAQKRLATGEDIQRNEQFENIQKLKTSYKDVGNPTLLEFRLFWSKFAESIV